MTRGCYSSSTSVSATEFIFKSATPASGPRSHPHPLRENPAQHFFRDFLYFPGGSPKAVQAASGLQDVPPSAHRCSPSARLAAPASLAAAAFPFLETCFLLPRAFPNALHPAVFSLPCSGLSQAVLFLPAGGVRGKLTLPLSPGPGDTFS